MSISTPRCALCGRTLLEHTLPNTYPCLGFEPHNVGLLEFYALVKRVEALERWRDFMHAASVSTAPNIQEQQGKVDVEATP